MAHPHDAPAAHKCKAAEPVALGRRFKSCGSLGDGFQIAFSLPDLNLLRLALLPFRSG